MKGSYSHFQIKYIQGNENKVADALSRIRENQEKIEYELEKDDNGKIRKENLEEIPWKYTSLKPVKNADFKHASQKQPGPKQIFLTRKLLQLASQSFFIC
jgi:hypothetical protein